MAIGFPSKNTHTLPPGRRGFAAEPPNVVAREIVRPGKYADGQDKMGTPEGAMHTTASSGRYDDAEAIRLRNAARGVGDRGLSGGTFGKSDNPTVNSKGRRNDARFGKFGLDSPVYRSLGEQPAPLIRGSELAARLRAKDVSRGGIIKGEVVGVTGGGFKYPSYKNSAAHKHTGDYVAARTEKPEPLDRAGYVGANRGKGPSER
jgi:hypothetical protein